MSGSIAHRHARQLGAAILIGGVVLVLELVAGFVANSLALIADAGHVFADISGMTLSFVAIRLAGRPRTAGRSFGLYRLEIVSAVANGLVLLVIAGVILAEAIRRFVAPPSIEPTIVMAVAAVAFVADLGAARLLMAGREALTLRAAYVEVLGDLLGSAAVLLSGAVVLATGWREADAVASIVVAALIVPRTVALLRESVDVLLEATPRGVNLDEVRRHILEAPGVTDVHDLHAWTITSGMNVVSAHVVLGPEGQPGDVLDHLGQCLADDFDINHSTFQLETPEHVVWEGRAAQVRH